MTSKNSKTAKPFGKQEYWESFYQSRDDAFSWYAGWDDLEPFIIEWMQPTDHILLPGVGSDRLVRDMYDSGFTTLSAFDYAPESIVFCRNMLGPDRQVDLVVADARELLFEDSSFDAVLDKGTLDAVYLIGDSPVEREQSLADAVKEIHRVLKPGGVFWSLSAICVDAITMDNNQWDVLADGSSLYTTEDGYTSNNLDGTLLVYRKKLS